MGRRSVGAHARIEYHSKAGYDAAGNIPKFAVKDAILSGVLLDPGTREVVLHLAQHRQRPHDA